MQSGASEHRATQRWRRRSGGGGVAAHLLPVYGRRLVHGYHPRPHRGSRGLHHRPQGRPPPIKAGRWGAQSPVVEPTPVVKAATPWWRAPTKVGPAGRPPPVKVSPLVSVHAAIGVIAGFRRRPTQLKAYRGRGQRSKLAMEAATGSFQLWRGGRHKKMPLRALQAPCRLLSPLFALP
jgi:hypothetical protein